MARSTITTVLTLAAVLTGTGFLDGAAASNGKIQNVIQGTDRNSNLNLIIQPQDPAQSGGGRDQSLQFGDILRGSHRDDVLIGALGIDILAGNRGSDVIIRGTEDFNPFNRDRAFGQQLKYPDNSQIRLST